MSKKNPWIEEAKTTITPTKHLLSKLSLKERINQYNLFKKLLKPSARTRVLDIGVTSDETFKDSNLFEKLYPYKERLTLLTIENVKKIQQIFPKATVVKIEPGHKLPFKDKEFDIATSWATLEHVGDYKDQRFFLSELIRMGKKIFITTPYRGCIYEPHTGFFFVHWLPLSTFRKICQNTGRTFWANKQNLNPLWVKDLYRMFPKGIIKVYIYKMFGFLPSHLIITNV